MSKRFDITHKTLRSMVVTDSDGYTITLDENGRAVTDSEHTAALLARMPRFEVSPDPTPYEALPPRPPPTPVRTSASTTPRQGTNTSQNVGDMGIEFDADEEAIPNAPDRVISPKNSPVVPEVVSAQLRMRYEAEADLVAIARGLMDPADLAGELVKSLDPRQQIEVLQAAFPREASRLQELERWRSQQEAYTEGLQATIEGLRAELKAAASPAPTKDDDSGGTKKPRK